MTLRAGFTSDDDTGRVLSRHSLCRMHGISISHTVISSAARNLFRHLFPSSFAKPFIGSTAHRLSAIRCFPFLAVGRAPSYRQRKRSLGFARDDDTGRTHFPHTLCMIQRISIPYTVISSAARNLFRHLFPSSFAKSFIGSTAHRLSAIRCFPFLAVGRTPSYRQRKRSLGFARDDDTGKTHFPHTLCMIQRISIPYTVISSAARNLPCTPSFLAPFAKGFPFSAIPHTALYRCTREIPPLRSG